MTDSTVNRRLRSLGAHRPHVHPSLQRVKDAYKRSRSRQRKLSRNPLRTQKVTDISPQNELKSSPWLPGDDYLLINAICRTWNLNEVFHTVRFAHYHTEKEIELRWHSLLFDPVISRTALEAIDRIPSLIKSQLDRQVPFSPLEEEHLAQVSVVDVFPQGAMQSLSLEDLQDSVFSRLLRDNPSVFYAGRDELDLFRHWNRLQTCFGHGPTLSDKPNQPESGTKSTALADSSTVDRLLNSSSCQHSATPVSMRDCPVGGDPEDFADMELLLKETVSSTLAAGLDKLTDPATVARRKHMLTQSTYHGFQALVADHIITELSSSALHKEADPFDRPVCSTMGDHGSHSPACTKKPIIQRSAPSPSSSPVISGDVRPKQELLKTKFSNNSMSDFHTQRRLELHRNRRRIWARLRNTGEQAKRWTKLVEAWVPHDFQANDNQLTHGILAYLTGNRTRFLIREKEVLFGRRSVAYTPHIDLSAEGDASRVSRCHGRIRLDVDGGFWLANFSTHPVYVDGHPVLKDEEVELRDLATLLIDHLAFRFDVNRSSIRSLCETTVDDDSPVTAKSSPLGSSPK